MARSAATKALRWSSLDLAAPDVAVGGRSGKGDRHFASRGYRALGVARAAANGAWATAGIIPLSDPLRPVSRSTIAVAKQMGVGVKMVTGDAIAMQRDCRQLAWERISSTLAVRQHQSRRVGSSRPD